MMKLILSLTLIWTLSSTAEALSCLVGEERQYSSHLCKPGDHCAAISTQAKVGGNIAIFTKRRCVPSCLFSEGSQKFSYNVGSGRTSVSVVVCKTDNCNNDYIMGHEMPVTNSLQCYTCDDPLSAVCNKTVQCMNREDRCLSGSAKNGKRFHALGCASANLCEVPARLEFLMNVTFLLPPLCCQSSFCNSAQTTEALSCLVGEGHQYSYRLCEPGDHCATIITQAHVGGTTSTKRLCVPSSLFSEEYQTFAHNVGSGPTFVIVTVCKTDDCNAHQPIDPEILVENGLQCYTCDDPYSAVCNKTVQCVKTEDRCLSGTANNSKTFHALGCASANLCGVPAHLEFLMNVTFPRPPQCCGSSFCNSAWSVKLNVITLLFGFIILIY